MSLEDVEYYNKVPQDISERLLIIAPVYPANLRFCIFLWFIVRDLGRTHDETHSEQISIASGARASTSPDLESGSERETATLWIRHT